MNVALGNVGESSSANSFHRLRTPSTVCGLLPPSADSFHRPRTPSTAVAVPLPRRGRSWGFAGQGLRPCRRLDIGALRSPLWTLRASYRRVVVITVTGAAIYETGAQCAPLRGTTMQPSVANASNRCNDAAQRCKRISPLRFLPRCRGAHRAPVDIPQTLDFPIPIPPSSREGDRPVGGGRSRRWKAFVPIAFMPNILLFSDARQAYEA